jgi:hypothetical protein
MKVAVFFSNRPMIRLLDYDDLREDSLVRLFG